MFGSFFEQDYLLNLTIIYFLWVGGGGWVPQKDDLNVKVFENRKSDVAQNLIVDFFLTLTVRGPIHRKDFKWKKIWGYGVNF